MCRRVETNGSGYVAPGVKTVFQPPLAPRKRFGDTILLTKRKTSCKYDRRSQPTPSLISFEGSSEVLSSALSLKSEF